MPITSKANLADRVLYMSFAGKGKAMSPSTGTTAEQYSAERNTARAASQGTIRITDKENLAARKDKVQEALMEESRAKSKAKKAKASAVNTVCCDGYEYCDIQALTPTHVAYKQGADMYGRTYMFDIGTGEVELGPRMTVHQELVFGKADSDSDD